MEADALASSPRFPTSLEAPQFPRASEDLATEFPLPGPAVQTAGGAGGVDRGSTSERARATSALGAENRPAPLASSARLGGRGRGAGPRGAPTRARAGRGVTATSPQRAGEGTDLRIGCAVDAEGWRRDGRRSCGAGRDDMLRSPGLSETEGSCARRTRALTPGVRRGAAPGSRCGSRTARTGAIPARGKQGARPPTTAEPLSVHPSPQVPNRESVRIPGGSGQAAPGRASLAPCLAFSLLDLEPRAGARAAAPPHRASQRPGLRPAGKRDGIGEGKALTWVTGSVPLRPLPEPVRRSPAQPSSKKKSREGQRGRAAQGSLRSGFFLRILPRSISGSVAGKGSRRPEGAARPGPSRGGGGGTSKLPPAARAGRL